MSVGERMSAERLLSRDAAGRLAHVLVGHTAAAAGIRALSVKGTFATEYGLREARLSADADIMAEPSALERLCERLGDRGWHTRAGRMPPTFIDLHSITLINDRWPCDLDIHRFFPGFFAAPEVVFELLWRTRDVHRTRGGEVLTPSRAGMAVIVALHAARAPYLARSQQDLAAVREAIATRFRDDEVEDFCEIVRGGRSQWVLRDLIADLGLPLTDDDATDAEKRTWTRNQQPVAEKSASLWIREIRNAPLRKKPSVVIHALWVPRVDIPRNDPERIPTVAEAISYQRVRWQRGFRALASYLRR